MKEPSAEEKLKMRELREQVRDKAKAVIVTGAWDISGKSASISLPNGTLEHDAIAAEVGSELQRHVSGRTPRIEKSGDKIIVTTEKLILAQAQSVLKREAHIAQ